MMLHVLQVNDCRKYLFSKLNCTFDQCSQTKDDLEQHILRAMLQSYIWSKSTQLKEQSIAMTDWGWDVDERGNVNPLRKHYRKLEKQAKS